MRLFPVLLVVLALADACCAQGWPTFRGDYLRSGLQGANSSIAWGDLGLLWSYTTGGPIESSPAIADINGDGRMEVVLGSDDGYVYALSHKGGLLWKYGTGAPVRSAPTLADVYGDNRTEVLIGSDDGNIYMLDKDGIRIWNFSTGGPVRGAPVVGKMDNTPGNKIMFGSGDGSIYALTADGRAIWTYKSGDGVYSSPALFDMDGDRQDDIIIGSGDNNVYIIKYPPYKVWAYLSAGDVAATPLIDSYGKIIVGSADRKVYRLEVRSIGEVQSRRVMVQGEITTVTVGMSGLQPIWNTSTDGPISSSAAAGNILKNGSYGIVVGSHDKALYFIDGNGTVNYTYSMNKPIDASPAIADLNGDGMGDVVVGCDDGGIYVVDAYRGRMFAYQSGGEVKSSPAIADMRGDGTLEFAAGSKDGTIYAFGSVTMRNISEGDEIYRMAVREKDTGSIPDAIRHLAQANETYARAHHEKGVKMAEALGKSIEADGIMIGAASLYGEGNIQEANSRADRASTLYTEANDTTGTAKAETLKRRIEADTYAQEAEYFIGAGLRQNATEYAQAAREYYMSINDTEDAEKIMNRTEGMTGDDQAKNRLHPNVPAKKRPVTVKDNRTSADETSRNWGCLGWPAAAAIIACIMAAGWTAVRISRR